MLGRVRNGGPWFPGALLLLLGTVFLLEEFGILEEGISTFWPIIIILIGIAIMSRGFKPRDKVDGGPAEDTISRFAMPRGSPS